MKTIVQTIALVLLNWIPTLCWWSLMVALPFLPFLAIGLATSNGPFSMPVPVKFEQVVVKVPDIEYDNFHKTINATRGTFRLSFEPTWQNKAIWLLYFVTVVAGLVIVTFQVRKILKTLWYNNPFDESNYRRVRIVAAVLIAWFVGRVIFLFLIEKSILSTVNFSHVTLAYDNDMVVLWTGLAMLVLEAVFKRGRDLDEDDQLTI